MSIELKRIKNTATAQIVSIGQHRLTVDMSIAEGGLDEGPNPHDLYDAALGACKALTVLWYANKKGIPVDDIRTSIQRDNSSEKTGTYRLAATVHVSGDLSDEQIKELEMIAGKCPIHKLMTTVNTEITSVVERM
ncbi:OsmC family protein [Solimicrobium silvestre]|uniref:Putative redox protein regulator of disulfide bond formation n=1 Tax=Solimicrobium silvestre TaxID=2099400 RepID=A0A2S9GZ53_9BURK|nr:OsmC family protein [Solimicrobium silvestre]PRC92983.1 putative redox protein regulator of disulfide bond formation [Solimicrobium silvestre]